MKDIGKLVDAICEAYRLALPRKDGKGLNRFEPEFVPSRNPAERGTYRTHCNEAFNLVAMRMGCDSFDRRETEDPVDAKLANVIYRMMADPAGLWAEISAGKAQSMANEGALVAAIDKNLTGPGHVCTVMPGVMEFSATFTEMVPRVMNIGKDVFIGMKASLAFRPDDKPRYFCLKADLDPAYLSPRQEAI